MFCFVCVHLGVCACVFVPIKIGAEIDGGDGEGEIENVYLQYSPEWVFIFRHQNNLFTF